MSKKKDIIRKDCLVKIINPEFFIRCGYPIAFNDVYSDIKKKHFVEIRRFVKSFDFIKNNIPKQEFYLEESMLDTTVLEIVRRLSYLYLQLKKFGGRERKIYTEEIPELKDQIMKVISTKTVKTGVYSLGGNYNSMNDDYDPPELTNSKTHKILNVFTYPPKGDIRFFKIEVKNVKKCLT